MGVPVVHKRVQGNARAKIVGVIVRPSARLSDVAAVGESLGMNVLVKGERCILSGKDIEDWKRVGPNRLKHRIAGKP